MVDCHQPQGAPCKYSQCHGLAVQPDSWPIVYSLIGSAKLPCFRTAQACLITVVKISLLTESDIILRMLYSLIAFIDCYLLTFFVISCSLSTSNKHYDDDNDDDVRLLV